MEKTPRAAGFASLSSARASVPDRRSGALRSLLDAGADLEALERHDLRLGTLQQLFDRHVQVLDVRLAGERDLAQGLAQPALDHPGDDLRRLALALGLLRRSEERRVGKECRSRWSPY